MVDLVIFQIIVVDKKAEIRLLMPDFRLLGNDTKKETSLVFKLKIQLTLIVILCFFWKRIVVDKQLFANDCG